MTRQKEKKVCKHCGLEKPRAQFVRSSHGPQVCRECFKQTPQLERLQGELERDAEESVEQFIREVPRIESPHISEAAEAVFQDFHRRWSSNKSGLIAWARKFADQVEKVEDGSVAAIRVHGAVIALIKASTEHRRSAPDMTDLYTEDEMWAEVEKQMEARGMVVNPNKLTDEQIAELARKRGFNVVKEDAA